MTFCSTLSRKPHAKQNQEDSSTNLRPTKALITTPSLMKDKMIEVQIMVTKGEKCMLYSGE
jgi:hypothetical protein